VRDTRGREEWRSTGFVLRDTMLAAGEGDWR